MKMLKNRMLSVFMVLAMVMTMIGAGSLGVFAAGGTMSGEGTADSPYMVEDAADFAAMAANGHYALADDITITESYPNEFTGTFDGNGYTITIGSEDVPSTTGGAFKTLGIGGEISNLTVDGVISGTGAFGGIANTTNGGTIAKCANYADITVTARSGRGGGIAGTATGASNNLVISECANYGVITATGATGYASGICPYIAGTVQITKCYNAGAIDGKNRSAGITCQYGSSNPITYCANTGELLTASTKGEIIGFSATADCAVNCYWVESGNSAIGGGAGTVSECEAVADTAAIAAKLADAGFVVDEDGNLCLGWEAEGEDPGEDPEPEVDPEDQAMAEAIMAKYQAELGALRPAYGNGNIAEYVAERIAAYDIEGMDADEISVAVASTDDSDIIAEDGTINFIASETPSQMGTNSKNVAVTFEITYGTATVTTSSRNVTVGWNRDYVNSKITADADALTLEALLGDNESADAVESSLVLPQCMGTSARQVWSKITWESSEPGIISFKEAEYSGITTPLEGVITAPVEDTEVTLTASFEVNDVILNSYIGETPAGFGTATKSFTVTVKGAGIPKPTEEELNAILTQYYTADLLTDSATGDAIDLSAVTGNIQLPRYTRIKDADNNLVFENKEITVTSSDESVISINGYRANVDRFQSENKTVDLIVTFTRDEVTTSITIPVTVVAITEADLQAEIDKLALVKAQYFNAISNGQSADEITEDLHAFQEANVDENGEVSWVYQASDLTNTGFVADGYFTDSVEMEAAGYNKFRSSEPSVISHENLLVTRPEDSTEVTITSWLTSEKYGQFATAHPDNELLQKLYKQEVSATVTVVGTVSHEPPAPVDPAAPAEVKVTVSNAGSYAKAKDGSMMIEKPVTVEDINEDGKLTVDETLVAAHKAYSANGADDYVGGGWVTKLWGIANPSAGFYKNDVSTAAVNEETVVVGDDVHAFIYGDAVGWTDKYAAFEKKHIEAVAGEEVTVVLLGTGYDSSWNTVTAPIEGAEIVAIDPESGEITPFNVKTDAEGKATISFAGGGACVVTAIAPEGVYMTPPTCTVDVTAPIESVKLGAAKLFFNKKTRIPKITVGDGTDNVLVKGRDYNVTIKNVYGKVVTAPKAVGKYTVTVTGEGCFTGKIVKTYRILPAKAAVKSVKAGKGKITAKMKTKARTKGGTKYQIRYKVKGAKKWKTVTTTSKTKTIKVKSGKKYLVKIRVAKKVKGVTYAGKWSKTRTLKVR